MPPLEPPAAEPVKRDFLDAFMIRACTAGLPLTAVLLVAALVLGDAIIAGAGIGGMAGCLFGIWAGRRGRGRMAAWGLLLGLSFTSASSTLFKPWDALAFTATTHAVMYPVFATLALGRRAGIAVALWNIGLYAFAFPWVYLHTDTAAGVLAYEFTMLAFGVAITTAGAIFFSERGARLVARLDQRLSDIGLGVEVARQIAAGDLRQERAGGGQFGEVLGEMLEGLRLVVGRIRDAAGALEPLSIELKGLAAKHGEHASIQSAAVASIRASADEAAAAGQEIIAAAELVAALAQESMQSTEATAERSERLVADTSRIATLLDAISDVGQQSDVLALNAELEGIRAGVAGGSFNIVASRMRELSDRVGELAVELGSVNRQLES